MLNTYYLITTFILCSLEQLFRRSWYLYSSRHTVSKLYKSIQSPAAAQNVSSKVYSSNVYIVAIRGKYRYLNGNIKYFLTGLENALTKIDGKY